MASMKHRLLVTGDWQVPCHDEGLLFDWLPRVVRDVQPSTIALNGDIIDTKGLGGHGEWEKDLLDEIEIASEAMKAIRLAAPRARREMNDGNHEERLDREGKVPPYLRRLVNLSRLEQGKELALWGPSREYRKDKDGVYEEGPVYVCHGWNLNHGVEAVEVAEMMGGRYEGRLCVFGHTHAPTHQAVQVRRTQRIPMSLWWANHGTLCDPKQLTYARGHNTSLWGPGVVVVEHDGALKWRYELISP